MQAPLDGASVEGQVAIFLAVQGDVRKVDFYLDDPANAGEPANTEYFEPFDFLGTNEDQSPILFDASSYSDGPHVLVAIATQANDESETSFTQERFQASFTVGTPAVPTTVATSTTQPIPTTTAATTTTTTTTRPPATTIPPIDVPPTTVVAPTESVSTSGSLIGLPWSGDGTGRMIVKEYSQVDHVWTAPKTGTVARIQVALTGAYDAGPGYTGTDENVDYASGTGGVFRADVYADDGKGNPTGPSLAHYQKAAGYINGKNPTGYQTDADLRELTPSLPVVAGTRYHTIWTNPDPNASVNWYGINNFSTRAKQFSEGAAQQTHLLPSSEWDVRYRAWGGMYSTGWSGLADQSGWKSCANQVITDNCYIDSMFFTPMHVIGYSDWSVFGNPYFGSIGINPELNTPNVDPSNSDRQTVTVLNSTSVEGIEVSLAAKSAGTMTARVTDLSGALIPGAVATADVALSPALRPPSETLGLVCNPYPNPGNNSCTTNTVRKFFKFPSTVTLPPGSYAIEFSASSGSFALGMARPDRGFYETFGPGSGNRGEAQRKTSGGSWVTIKPDSYGTFDIFTALTPAGSRAG